MILRDPSCQKCQLHTSCKTVCVGYTGAEEVPLDVLFVGEAPGAEEDERGIPFIGPAGQLLRRAIREFIPPVKWGITNVVKCRPPENRTPKAVESKACADYLWAEVAHYRPKTVVPLGNIALRALTKQTGITKVAGRVLPLEEERLKGSEVFPIVHPSAVLRSPGLLPEFEACFQRLGQVLRARNGDALPMIPVTKVTVSEAITYLRNLPWGSKVAVDLETTHLNPRFGEIVTAAFCRVDEPEPTAIWFEWPRTVVAYDLKAAILETFNPKGPDVTMVCHNATFEVKWLIHHVWGGDRTARWTVEDTKILHHLLDENSPAGLDHLAAIYTPYGGYADDVMNLVSQGKKHHELPLDVLGPYNAKDAYVTAYCARTLLPQVEADEGLASVWDGIMEPAVFAVAMAEYAGRKVDYDRVEVLKAEKAAFIEQVQPRLLEEPAVVAYVRDRLRRGDPVAGGVFNPDSPLQIADVLFDKLRVPKVGKTKEGKWSVRSAYLRPFAEQFPFLKDYLAFKEAQTLLKKYLTPLGTYVMPDGFLYGGYLLSGTVTGRLASTEPNLQNFSEELRTCVVSRFPEGRIVEADFVQLELRLMAWLAKCPPLLEAFRRGEDVHRLTASMILHKAVEAITKPERQDYGKRPNFALIYGAGAKRFHLEFGVPMEEAYQIVDGFFDAYPEIRGFLTTTHRLVMNEGQIRSRLGRVRRLPEAKSSDEDVRHRALLQASNFPVQSLGNDLNTWAFTQVRERFHHLGLKALPIGLTHDSGTYDVPPEEVDVVAETLIEVMVKGISQRFPWLEIPMAVDVKAGPSWGTLEPWVKKPQGDPKPVRLDYCMGTPPPPPPPPPVSAPPPPPPPPQEEFEKVLAAKRSQEILPDFIGGTIGQVSAPDRLTLGMHLKYGLPNYGSVSVDVDYETTMRPDEDPDRMYLRARNVLNHLFEQRDQEVREACGISSTKEQP